MSLEIARRLQAVNEPVAKLILIDAPGLNAHFAAVVAAGNRAAALLRFDHRRLLGIYGVIGRIAALLEQATISISAARKESRLIPWIATMVGLPASMRPAMGKDEGSLLECAYNDIVARYIPAP